MILVILGIATQWKCAAVKVRLSDGFSALESCSQVANPVWARCTLVKRKQVFPRMVRLMPCLTNDSHQRKLFTYQRALKNNNWSTHSLDKIKSYTSLLDRVTSWVQELTVTFFPSSLSVSVIPPVLLRLQKCMQPWTTKLAWKDCRLFKFITGKINQTRPVGRLSSSVDQKQTAASQPDGPYFKQPTMIYENVYCLLGWWNLTPLFEWLKIEG